MTLLASFRIVTASTSIGSVWRPASTILELTKLPTRLYRAVVPTPPYPDALEFVVTRICWLVSATVTPESLKVSQEALKELSLKLSVNVSVLGKKMPSTENSM
jgi:hypothetical protein